MNKTIAIVTGGGAGIGLATCILLSKNNYHVVVSDINVEAGENAVTTIQEAGGSAAFMQANVADYHQVQSLVAGTVETHGRIDLIVNNAGIGTSTFMKVAQHTLEEWDKVIAVNQSGVFYGMKAALGFMEKQGFGNIVNVASLAGVKASTTGMAYSASKFAVVGMTKSAALEYASKNIRINCVCPSFTETDLLEKSNLHHPDIKEKLIRSIPMKRYGSPEEIAEAIYWLASDKSSFVTGHSLIIDGGLVL